MGLELQIVIVFGYNVLLFELLLIAWMAWQHNGVATTGTGRLIGPFALILASIVMRINVSLALSLIDSHFTEETTWLILGVVQLWGAVLVGGFVCDHMIRRVRENRKTTQKGT